jgi:hypothetical protein
MPITPSQGHTSHSILYKHPPPLPSQSVVVFTNLIMANTLRNSNSAAARSQPSRLQRRRPASLQISPASSSSSSTSCWKVAIPLLSPLITSPTAMDMKSREDPQPPPRSQGTEGEKPVVFTKWQHPAAPLCYEPAKFKPSFSVPV